MHLRLRVSLLVLTLSLAVPTCFAIDEAGARQAITAAYARSTSELKRAKNIEDLDAIHAWMDTADWVSVQPGQQPQTWQQMRSYGFSKLFAPFTDMRFDISALKIVGDTAIAEGTFRVTSTMADSDGHFGSKGAFHVIVVAAPLRETWVQTADGWRRKRHEKLVQNHVESVDGKAIQTILAGQH